MGLVIWGWLGRLGEVNGEWRIAFGILHSRIKGLGVLFEDIARERFGRRGVCDGSDIVWDERFGLGKGGA